jgi:cytochrome P450
MMERSDNPASGDPWYGYGEQSFFAHPYSVLANLRRQGAAQIHPSHGSYMIPGYEDIQKICRTGGIAKSLLGESLASAVAFQNGATHARMRTVLNRGFTVSSIQRWEPKITAIVNELLSAARARGNQMEFMEQFAIPLPLFVIAEILGVPRSDCSKLHHWSAGLVPDFGSDPQAGLRLMQESVAKLTEYFTCLVEERGRKPGTDFLSSVMWEADGKRSSSEVVIWFTQQACYSLLDMRPRSISLETGCFVVGASWPVLNVAERPCSTGVGN